METSKLCCGGEEDIAISTTCCSKPSVWPPPRPNSSLFKKPRKSAPLTDSRQEPVWDDPTDALLHRDVHLLFGEFFLATRDSYAGDPARHSEGHRWHNANFTCLQLNLARSERAHPRPGHCDLVRGRRQALEREL